MLTPDASASLEAIGRNPDLLIARGNKKLCERRLIDFMEKYWSVLHPGKVMKRGWALEAICDHLEGVHLGHISHLLITVPPGFSKSMSTNVFFPAWEWGPRRTPGLQYLSAAYTDELTQRDNERARALMGSPEYQANWGDVFSFDKNVDGRIKFMNDKRGHKQATSVKGQATGGRGDRLIADDPHNVLTTDSDQVRQETVRWFTEAWSSRTNSEASAFITMMQRINETDVAAACIELGYVHLCIPMMFEWDHPHRWFGGGHIAHEPVRKRVEEIEAKAVAEGAPLTRDKAFEEFLKAPDCDEVCDQVGYVADGGDATQVSFAPQYGKGDPRAEDDELAFPELFSMRRVKRMIRQMSLNDPQYAVAGQLQQRPAPREGGDIKDEYIKYVELKDVPEGGTHVEAGWDLAGSNGKKSPFTVKVNGKYGPDGILYIMGRYKERVESDKLDDAVLREMDADGKGVRHNLPQDPGQAGKYQKKAMSKKFRGHWFVFSVEVGSKEQRAKPVVSQFGAGNVRIVRGPWNRDYVSNLKKWPAGKYKDDMDATSRMDMGLVDMTRKKRGRITSQMVVKQRIYRDEGDD
jgi:predicted phage terminase large subunit-like protein